MSKKQNPEAIRSEFERATQDLSAWLVQKNGETVAKIVVKYGGRKSPHGLTVRAYVWVLGLPMVRGIARGGGCDMKSAAILSAVQHLNHPMMEPGTVTERVGLAFATLKDNGHDIPHQLRELGYAVEWVM